MNFICLFFYSPLPLFSLCTYASLFSFTKFRRNQDLIKELSTPQPGAKDLYFPTQYSQGFITQCIACFWKQYWSYWRNSQYNAVRFVMTAAIGFLFGLIFFGKGDQT